MPSMTPGADPGFWKGSFIVYENEAHVARGKFLGWPRPLLIWKEYFVPVDFNNADSLSSDIVVRK